MLLRLILALAIAGALAPVALAAPKLERVVLVMRHGIRPPTHPNAEIAKYADKPWPEWPAAAGELTPHGGEAVRLMGQTLRARYVGAGVLPATGCAPDAEVSVWADGTDQRTRRTGEILAAALEPGCPLKAGWAPPQPRDPIFSGSDAGACKVDPDKAREAIAAAAAEVQRNRARELAAATARLQAILAPEACRSGPGTCLSPKGEATEGARTPYPPEAALAEDLYLEYADGKPMREVGWGRASRADIDEVMRVHEAAFEAVGDDAYLAARRGAPMARLVLSALAGDPLFGGPEGGSDLKLLALAGHDSNLAWSGALFGLKWKLPGQVEAMAPATVLAFELWSDGARRYVRPVIYYETLDQMRTLTPARAERLDLTFEDCASGPRGSCPLSELQARLARLIPPGCGDSAAPAGAPPRR